MNISALASILSEDAVEKLARHHIRTVEALVARAQDEEGRRALSRLLGLTEERTAEVLKAAQALVPAFDAAQKYPDVGRGALHPSFKRR